MPKLEFTSRGSGTVGKNRVYLLYHEEDFGERVRPLMEQILALQDCLIFYRDPKSKDADVMDESTVQRFQLVIVYVTEAFLLRPEEHFAGELQLAEKNNIPILPILNDAGLCDLYTQCFENIQYLSQDNHDPTEIPYEKKLADFLQGILTGDDISRQITRAFRAHLFISYRKKDREHAQRFMRLIHKHEDLRDLAFWYDEYLVPGEDFNEGIREALSNCDIFALVITPNLVNEKNYVQQTEYPMAQACRKDHMLAAELLPTARPKLEQQYPGLPEIISPEETEKLRYVLNDLLKKDAGDAEKGTRDIGIAEKSGMDVDERDFLRGLAYLTGTEVEMDAQYGLSLLRETADRGYRPAIRKLGYVYRFGQGTAIDHGEALSWMKKLTDPAKPSGTTDELLQDLSELARYQTELGLYEEAEQAFEKCIEYLPNGLERGLMAANLSGIERQLGRTDEAFEYARICLDCAALCPDRSSFEYRILKSLGSEHLGDALEDTGHLEQAFDCHRSAYALQRLERCDGRVFEPEIGILQLGKMIHDKLRLGETEDAEHYMQLQRREIDELLKYRPTWQTKRLLWQNLESQKSILIRQEHIGEAMAISEDLLQKRKEAAQVNESPEDLYQLAKECREYYQLSLKRSDRPQVTELVRAYKIITLLVKDRPEVYDYQYELNELQKLMKNAQYFS